MDFKPLGFIVLIYFSITTVIVSAHDDDICAEEVLELHRLVDQTCGTDKLFTLNNLFIKASRGEYSHDELRSYIEISCQSINATVDCLTNLKPVIPECYGNPLTQYYRNEQSLFVLRNKYLCEHNPPRYLDFLKYDGITCFAANVARNRCMDELRNKNRLEYSNEVLDENICKFLDITGRCLNTYENCTNRYVENYLVVLTELAVDAFNCPKNY